MDGGYRKSSGKLPLDTQVERAARATADSLRKVKEQQQRAWEMQQEQQWQRGPYMR